jgi:hypothetical protein
MITILSLPDKKRAEAVASALFLSGRDRTSLPQATNKEEGRPKAFLFLVALNE